MGVKGELCAEENVENETGTAWGPMGKGNRCQFWKQNNIVGMILRKLMWKH